MARTATYSTSKVVRTFVREYIMHPFGLRKTIASNNAAYFTANKLSSFMIYYGIELKLVLASAPMSNGRVNQMVGTIKKGIKKTVLG